MSLACEGVKEAHAVFLLDMGGRRRAPPYGARAALRRRQPAMPSVSWPDFSPPPPPAGGTVCAPLHDADRAPATASLCRSPGTIL